MSRVHIVVGHPNPRSYNAHLAEIASTEFRKKGWGVSVTNLGAIDFDPREGAHHYPSFDTASEYNVQREQRRAAEQSSLPAFVADEIRLLEEADFVILQFPLWWFSAPAVMKGWFDRVFVYGKVYTSKMRHDRGFFKGKRAMLSVTCGGPRQTFLYNGRNGDIDILLWPMNFSLSYVGMTILKPEVLYGVQAEMSSAPDQELRQTLDQNTEQFRRRMESIEHSEVLSFNGWDDWEDGRLKPGIKGHSLVMRANPIV